MAPIFTGPGKITIELTAPTKKAMPMWRILLRFIVLGIMILLILRGLTWLTYFLG